MRNRATSCYRVTFLWVARVGVVTSDGSIVANGCEAVSVAGVHGTCVVVVADYG
jgi:hypothetical protein